VTYNLYLVDPASELGAPPITPNLKSVSNFQTTLQRLLKSPEFLPDGGTLGFGLAHLYAVTFETKLQEMTSYLKGEDAHVCRTCRELQLRPLLQMIYNDVRSGSEYGIMLDKVVERPDYDCEHQDESYESALVIEKGGVSVNKTQGAAPDHSPWVTDGDCEGEFITWISPFNGRNQLKDVSLAYGNEVVANYAYCSPCLIVRIAPASDRV
jgi:hypothetical protein